MPHVRTRKKIEFRHNPTVVIGTLITKSISYANEAPADFRSKILSLLKEWKLVNVETSEENLDPASFINVLHGARAIAEQLGADFLIAYSQAEWKHGSIESRYTDEEANRVIPLIKEVGDRLKNQGEKVSYIWWFSHGNYPLNLVERNDTRRQVFKIVNTDKTADEINQLSKHRPSIIPPFEALKLSDGRTAVLIEWIDGHYPKSLEDMKLIESRLGELCTVPLAPNREEFDLNRTNFKTTEKNEVFYVDSDLVENIAKMGFSRPSAEQFRKIANGIVNRFRVV